MTEFSSTVMTLNVTVGKEIRNSALRIGILILILIFFKVSISYGETTIESEYEKVIAHGGGAYHGYETTNSVEALNHAIQSGYRIIELDMELSSDEKIIMLHDWDRTAKHYYNTSFDRKISQHRFNRLSVHGELEVLTFEKLSKILEVNPEILIITDTKGDNLAILSKIAKEYPNQVKQIIPQIYGFVQWIKVKELGYSNIILTLYAMRDIDEDKLVSFVMKKDLYAVAMPDYLAEQGLCSRLSQEGIKVYVHPVSTYEDAQYFISQGAWGVYSGTLLPEEFAGFEKDFYLTIDDEDGTAVKLTDNEVESLNELKLSGIKDGDEVLFFVDESSQNIDDPKLSDLDSGKHQLTVTVFRDGKLLGSLNYLLLKDSDKLRVLHKKYRYRFDLVKKEKDFSEVMLDNGVPLEIIKILEKSFIAKKGEYIFYSEGKLGHYMNGDDYLPVQAGSFGKQLLPLSTTAQFLGADSVIMDKSKDISIIYNNEKCMVMVDSYLFRKGSGRIIRMRTPVVLYLNKAMAGGEFYSYLTGRNFIEKEDLIILLPEKLELGGRGIEETIIKAAANLF